jgi:hypothetical protein
LVFTNSHFGQAKVQLSPPPGCGALRDSIMRPRHIAQRGGLREVGASSLGGCMSINRVSAG